MRKQVLVGLVVLGLGGVIIYFSQQLTEAFGRSAWAEQHLGSTRNMYVMIGFAMIVLGFLFVFNVISVESPVASM